MFQLTVSMPEWIYWTKDYRTLYGAKAAACYHTVGGKLKWRQEHKRHVRRAREAAFDYTIVCKKPEN